MSQQNQGKLPGGTSKAGSENERLLWQSREAGGEGQGLCPRRVQCKELKAAAAGLQHVLPASPAG